MPVTGLVSQIWFHAVSYRVDDTTQAAGQSIAISDNRPLFSLLGTTYGGDGRTTFSLPNMVASAARGGLQALGSRTTLGSGTGTAAVELRALICADGDWPTWLTGDEMIGEILMLSGNAGTPPGAYLCNGKLLNVQAEQALFSVISNAYGGDGKTTFAVPNLIDAVPQHPKDGWPTGTYMPPDWYGAVVPPASGSGPVAATTLLPYIVARGSYPVSGEW